MLRLEGKTLVLVTFILLFWFSAWGLLEEGPQWLEVHGGDSKGQVYTVIFLGVIFYILCVPEFLGRI